MLRCSIVLAVLGLASPACVSDHTLGGLPEPDTGTVEEASTVDDGHSQSATSAEPSTDEPPTSDEREVLCEAYCAGGCLLGRSRAHCLYECNAEFEYADHPLAPETCEAGWEAYLGCMISNDCISARCDSDRQTYLSAGCTSPCTFSPDGDCFLEWGCRIGEQPRTIACTGDACTCYTDGTPDGTCVSEAACTGGTSGRAFALSCCGYDDYPDFPPSGP